ncbi:hypothetical protein PLEOSDRAFT_1104997 [Pleurotus ostreatus PC15]|uniref:Uncharacterized protein n=1 Tax=Pleurotus ostreatus (strain PC15) TaxID=1137138 RepID=A0A067NXL6_PLEO1|nr:hypothetical protein PLEOSDRAFT_1104997 [Pleurotus ostreatus PC15]
MNCQGLTDAIGGSFPALTPQQIVEGGYTPAADPPHANIPTRPNTPQPGNTQNSFASALDPDAPQNPASPSQETTASGKKRRRIEGDTVDQPRDENTMEEDLPGV